MSSLLFSENMPYAAIVIDILRVNFSKMLFLVTHPEANDVCNARKGPLCKKKKKKNAGNQGPNQPAQFCTVLSGIHLTLTESNVFCRIYMSVLRIRDGHDWTLQMCQLICDFTVYIMSKGPFFCTAHQMTISHAFFP